MEGTVMIMDGIRIPWPGPRPYDEEHWDDFLGRDFELVELLDRVRVNKLTILLGGSGTGKTSLIRAGLVPLLRQERYHPQGDQATWPVLLLRRWGNVGSSSLEEDLLLQLESAIQAIRRWGKRLAQERASTDASALSAELEQFSGKATVLEVIETLARAQARLSAGSQRGAGEEGGDLNGRGGLILIFDQFEEQLRAGAQARSHALELIGDLVRSKAPTRILLSMRQEYQYTLRPLELLVGGLSGRSYFLGPMKEATVVGVVKESSKKSNIPIDEDVAEQIVRWLAYQKDGRVPSLNEASADKEADLHDEAGRPDLLQLQAVLLELSRYALGRRQSRIDRVLFDEFTSGFAESTDGLSEVSQEGDVSGRAKERVLALRVLGGALERWIESALRSEAEDEVRENVSSSFQDSRIQSQAKWAEMEPEDLRLQVRRIAVRLAPRLSSGDYKVSQEENTLFRQALGDEITRLGLKDPELRSKVRVIENQAGPPRLNWEDLDLPDVHAQGKQPILSGLARVQQWSPTQTGDKILICFKEALHRLATANILQYTPFGIEKLLYWELVHDQFGPNFTRWAEKQRGMWDDCKSSLAVCSGLQPIAVPVSEIKPPSGAEFYELVKISWQGCGIESSRPERLTLRRVLFKECFLVGTIFDNVDFVGCRFEDCDLTGVLFKKCAFRPDEEGQPTVFIHCDSNVAIVKSIIEQLEFRDCHLQQPAIVDSTLEGDVRYTHGSRVIQGFYDVRKGESVTKDVGVRFSAESRASFCTTSKAGGGYVEFREGLELHNAPLRDDFRTR